MDFLISPIGFALSIVVFIAFLLIMFNSFLIKAAPGEAIVKTGFGLKEAEISTSSAFVIPLLHKADRIDLTVKTIRISRRLHDSLSCADGIRAEVEVDFYIQINSITEDIRQVANTVGCERASNHQTVKELFEAKFADALKTAGSKLTFDALYQNRRQFRDEVLKALGQENDGNVVLNGYKLDDVAIQFLEQLPLTSHDDNNVLDAKGIKEIALRTSLETEAANQRLRQKEVTIAEQNREAKTKQLAIEQDLALKQATQEREIAAAKAAERALAEKAVQEQQRVEMEATIERERVIRLAEEKKLQEIEVAQRAKEQAIQIAEQEKIKQVEIATIQREIAQAEQLKAKLEKLEETAIQDAKKIVAEQQAITAREIEIAQRNKTIEVITAEKEAAVNAAKLNVETDVRSYELTTIAEAKYKAAQLDAQAAALQATSIVEVGKAEAEALRLKLEAESTLNDRVILSQALNQIIPLLPTIIEQLMKPAEKIDSIKILNVTGLDKVNGTASGGSGHPNVGSSVIQTVVGMGMAMPMLREIVGTLKTDDKYKDMYDSIRQIPGGELLMSYVERIGKEEQA